MAKSKLSLKLLWEQKYLLLLSVPFVIWALIFRYFPLVGWTMAFQDYKLGNNFFESKWVGFKHFILLFQDEYFYRALRNTLVLSGLGLTIGFVMPIIFALMLNEIKKDVFKKPIQTISYLPHFISWVITANLVSIMLSTEGPVNGLLISLGIVDRGIAFLGIPEAFWWILTGVDIWKEMGWNAIIFLAAISGVDQELYEAAEVDGAGRFRKMWSITLPSIMPVITVLLIMNIGWIISIGYEKQFLLGRPITREYSDVIDLYALNYGIGLGRYSYATAIGLFKSFISILLIFFANKVAKKFGQSGVV